MTYLRSVGRLSPALYLGSGFMYIGFRGYEGIIPA